MTGLLEVCALTGSATTLPGGEEDEYEKNMMGSCYQAPLNGQLAGGTLSWMGNPDDWVAGGVCVDWISDNFAWWCEVEWSGPDHWNLAACASLAPVQYCHPGITDFQ